MRHAVRAAASTPTQVLLQRLQQVRATTEALCAPLSAEDSVIQSMPDVSPPKWHLAHVSWFFEAFILRPYLPGYRSPDERYDALFNSYYQTHGTPFPRARRGMLSRPSLSQVYAYRHHIDQAMAHLLEHLPGAAAAEILRRVELGLQHEQQHQELLLMDIKHILAQNPLHPVYRDDLRRAMPPGLTAQPPSPLQWIGFPAGLREIGHSGQGFAFDCEQPRHRQYLEAFRLADRPVSNAEYLQFMQDQGYARPELWLADGWSWLQAEQVQAPLYWLRTDAGWQTLGLGGLQPLEPEAPVCHLSFYEADAYARWADARLPSEAEWEVAEHDRLSPQANPGRGLRQLFGDVWEWTSSAFRPYPGFQPLSGSLGEYNGKFMSGQMVLRGGCCATPQSHIRASYRNFFYPHMRWQFAGLRLARDERP
jgi:ergothioneine biosynthesis protein EgtB